VSVDDLLAKQSPDRRDALSRVRDVILRHLPSGYEESVSRGMITYAVPLARYPDTYNGQPLWYCAVAPQKNYLSLYLMPAYGSKALAQRLRDGFRAAGRKLDMGKSCIRFRAADDLALDVIGSIIAAVPVDKWVEIARAARAGTKSPARKTGAKRGSAKKRR
jgi:hypothetical protein